MGSLDSSAWVGWSGACWSCWSWAGSPSVGAGVREVRNECFGGVLFALKQGLPCYCGPWHFQLEWESSHQCISSSIPQGSLPPLGCMIESDAVEALLVWNCLLWDHQGIQGDHRDLSTTLQAHKWGNRWHNQGEPATLVDAALSTD